MDKSNTASSRKVNLVVFRVLAVFTVILGLFVRILGGGWLLILYGVFLLMIAGLHLILHFVASGSLARTGQPAGVWLVLSNVFFFFGFAVQADGGDTAACNIGLVNFVANLRGIEPWGDSVQLTMDVCGPANNLALALLGALLATWVIILVLLMLAKRRAPDSGPAQTA